MTCFLSAWAWSKLTPGAQCNCLEWVICEQRLPRPLVTLVDLASVLSRSFRALHGAGRLHFMAFLGQSAPISTE